MRRAAAIAMLVVLAIASAARPASADTTGRFTVMDDYTMMSGPNATIDALMLRLYLKVTKIGGKERSFVIDARSDLPALASAGSSPFGNLSSVAGIDEKYPFNNRCRGLSGPAQPCEKLPIRNVTLGQLQQLAGFYDLYYQIGDERPHETTFSIGRRTIYEAGLTTVDGLTVERALDESKRVGVYGGLSPDPLTRMFSADYQAAGAYFALQQKRTWIRFAGTSQLYQFKPDLVSLFNQDFVYLSKGITFAAFADFDVLPKAEDRLVYADLTVSPTSRYRLRLNLTRYRPTVFAESPELYLQNPDASLVAAWTAQSPLAGRFPQPEVLPKSAWYSAVTSGKLVAHYVTASSFTPYVSAQYQTRDIDKKSGEVVDVGVYTYTPHDIPIIGRAFLEYQTGWDFTAERLDAHIENDLTPDFSIGGGVDLISSTYPPPPSEQAPGSDDVYWTKSAQALTVDLFAHYDRAHGASFFADLQATDQNRKPGAEAHVLTGTPLPPPSKGSLDLSGLLGVTFRFGAGAPE